MPDIVLRTIGLSKRFGKRWAVKDLNLEIHRGDVFGFLGPNGAGKSTTIRMILTLLAPTAGSIELFGLDLHAHRSQVLARVCGIVEKPDFYLYLSAYRNLEILGSMTRPVTKQEITEALESVGLASRARDRVKTYSHGMKQRLGIAQALLTKPDIIVLDEPTSGLDPQGMKEVRELVRRLSTEREMTIFLSSHLLSEVEVVTTRIGVINHGELVAQGKVSELLGSAVTEYTLQVSQVDTALESIARLPFAEVLSSEDGRIELRIEPGRSAELNHTLVMDGIDVSSLSPRRSLEDYFLKITGGSSEV